MTHSSKFKFVVSMLMAFFLALALTSRAAPSDRGALSAAEVEAALRRSADWQLSAPTGIALNVWRIAPFYDGLIRLADITGDARYLAPVVRFGQQEGWQPGPSIYHADDQAVCHAWVDIYLRNRKITQRIAKTGELYDYILAHPVTEDMEHGKLPPPGRIVSDRWTWCDALYMAPPALARLYTATGDQRYLDFLEREWKFTHDKLWDSADRLYYRDSRFPTQRTANGKKIFWGRGNGWVLGGLALTLEHIPKDHSSRAFLENNFRELSEAVLRAQQADGLWRTNLADPEQFTIGETSGSGFLLFGLAWGINSGLLDREKTMPAVERGWRGLMTRIGDNGKVGYVQPVGASPEAISKDMSHEYGTGAFLLAGSEVLRALGATPPKSPDTLLAEAESLLASDRTPRAYARIVTARKDGLAWENDRVAFRVYGPALREAVEGSGIDVWMKRVDRPAIDRWYAADLERGENYHKDHGEGYDGYKVGDSLGCGGLALWRDGKIISSDVYQRAYVSWTTPDVARFTLVYEYPSADGATIREVRTIKLRLGEQTFEVISRFTDQATRPRPLSGLDVIAGLVTQTATPEIWFAPDRRAVAIWETIDGQRLGAGMAFPAGSVSRVETLPHSGTPQGARHALAFLKTDANGEVRYRAGFAWARAGMITNLDAWKKILAETPVATSAAFGHPMEQNNQPVVMEERAHAADARARADAVMPATREWLDLAITYVVHAETLWHEDAAGGYWGEGLEEKDPNGRVRGNCNTALAYAFIIHALDSGWVEGDLRARLNNARLDRKRLVSRVAANLRFLCEHHVSASATGELRWGNDWQSSLWLGAAGTAALLAWDDLSQPLKKKLSAVAASEADRIAAKPPADYKPGNTGAEENGWDTHAPAVALALDPNSPGAARWKRALRRYAANVYSVPSDATDDSRLGDERVRDVVCTKNLFPDYTLENHRFFHPDYMQVSGQELGEALLILELGDRVHGLKEAEAFRPYALHNAREVWKNVMQPLLLPDGQFAFPCGQDWTLHTSITPAYLAYVSTLLGDPAAARAEKLHVDHALRRRAVSPRGRILGDTNLTWWWEPLLIKRGAMAVLQHEVRKSPRVAAHDMLQVADTRLFPDAKVWLHRNAHYFVSASWGARPMATFTPFDSLYPENPYLTLPIPRSLLPAVNDAIVYPTSDTMLHCVALKTKDGATCVLAALPRSIVIVSSVPLNPLGIENDRLSGGRRIVHAQRDSFAARINIEAGKHGPRRIESPWLNIDDRLGMVASGPGFVYTQAHRYNQRSVAADMVVPLPGEAGMAWQLIPGVTREETARLAADFSVQWAPASGWGGSVAVRDPSGRVFKIILPDGACPAGIEEIPARQTN